MSVQVFFKWMDFLAWISPWTLYGYLNPGRRSILGVLPFILTSRSAGQNMVRCMRYSLFLNIFRKAFKSKVSTFSGFLFSSFRAPLSIRKVSNYVLTVVKLLKLKKIIKKNTFFSEIYSAHNLTLLWTRLPLTG